MLYVLFWTISALGLLLALGTVLARNLVHAALFLVGFFFIIACQFVLLEAEFLAAIQVLIYIGAVAILLLFGIMLTRNIQGDETTTVRWPARIAGAIVGLGVLAILVYGIADQVGLHGQLSWSQTVSRPVIFRPGTPESVNSPRSIAVNNMGKALGEEMMTRYVVPFEVAGLLLTAALVGAIALAQLEGADEEPAVPGLLAAGRPGPVTSGNGVPVTAGAAPLTQPASELR